MSLCFQLETLCKKELVEVSQYTTGSLLYGIVILLWANNWMIIENMCVFGDRSMFYVNILNQGRYM